MNIESNWKTREQLRKVVQKLIKKIEKKKLEYEDILFEFQHFLDCISDK